MAKDVSAIVDEYTYDLMCIMFQHIEYDQKNKWYKLSDFRGDLNELDKKIDTEVNSQCLSDLLPE
nr:MAG TPA: hypothetical protein [Caudoviricetes sp.]